MQHSLQTKKMVHGLLSRELLHCIATERPLLLPDTGLPQILNIDQAVQLACQLARKEPGKVQILGDNEVVIYRSTPWWFKPAPKHLNMLRQHATMRINFLEDDFPPLKELCLALGGVLGTRVQVHAYLGGMGSHGLRTHYDEHDVLVVQQQGQKLWRVSSHNNKHTYFEEILTPGDAVSIPVELYHHALTLRDADSLHLTFGFRMPTRDHTEILWANLDRFLTANAVAV